MGEEDREGETGSRVQLKERLVKNNFNMKSSRTNCLFNLTCLLRWLIII